MEEFYKIRQSTIKMVSSLNKDDWNKEAHHPEYKRYTPYIMPRHLLVHDHNHLYKITDMGLGI